MSDQHFTISVGDLLHNLGLLANAYESMANGGKPFFVDPVQASAQCKAAWLLLQKLPVWIPVSERLPEDDGWVLGFQKWIPDVYKCDEGVMACWYYHSKGKWKTCEEYDTLPNVTHWMPLPPPPEQ